MRTNSYNRSQSLTKSLIQKVLLLGVMGVPAAGIARWLPPVEILTGGLLIIGLFTPLAAVAGFTLLLVFAGAVGLAVWRGKEVNCGCFGAANKSKAQWKIVYRNLALMAMLLPALATAVAKSDSA